MADYASTLAEELAKNGVSGSYSWKPNRMYVRNGNHYNSVDVVSDGSSSEIAAMVTEAGQARISEIDALAAAQKVLITYSEQDYRTVKKSLLQTYDRLYNYFTYQKQPALRDMIADAIAELNKNSEEESDDG